MRKYKSHELVDFKPRSLSSLKYDIDGMLPRSKSGHVVYCIFSRGSLLLITLQFATFTGTGSIPRYILDKMLKVRLHPQLLRSQKFQVF